MENTKELIRATTPTELLELAVAQNLDIDKLERLVAMKERYDREVARKEYFSALAQFQYDCPELRKTKGVKFKENEPDKYVYAPLGDIDRQIKKLLKDNGLTKTWKIFDEAGKIKVVCIITHTQGHSEQTEMISEADMSGAKNPIQGKGSAIEYMKRYTLIGALGLTTTDSDIDGRLPELDIDKLHKQYMELFNQAIIKDPNLRTAMDPDNWNAERTTDLYLKAIGKARQILAKLTPQKP